jgi:hypothetical protein
LGEEGGAVSWVHQDRLHEEQTTRQSSIDSATRTDEDAIPWTKEGREKEGHFTVNLEKIYNPEIQSNLMWIVLLSADLADVGPCMPRQPTKPPRGVKWTV